MNPSSQTFRVSNAALKSSLLSLSVWESGSLVITSTWFYQAGYLLKINLCFLVRFSSMQMPGSNGFKKTSDYLNPNYCYSVRGLTRSVIMKSMPIYLWVWT